MPNSTEVNGLPLPRTACWSAGSALHVHIIHGHSSACACTRECVCVDVCLSQPPRTRTTHTDTLERTGAPARLHGMWSDLLTALATLKQRVYILYEFSVSVCVCVRET